MLIYHNTSTYIHEGNCYQYSPAITPNCLTTSQLGFLEDFLYDVLFSFQYFLLESLHKTQTWQGKSILCVYNMMICSICMYIIYRYYVHGLLMLPLLRSHPPLPSPQSLKPIVTFTSSKRKSHSEVRPLCNPKAWKSFYL